MNIIVCDDTRLLGKPYNQYLCELLIKRGHKVELFDGRTQDIPILDCLNCASRLAERIAAFGEEKPSHNKKRINGSHNKHLDWIFKREHFF